MTEKQKIAWVTGASSGIGAAVTLRLVKDGWIVAATARSEDKIEVLVHHVEAFGVGTGRVINYPGDVTDPQKMNEIVARIENDLGPIDLALLNAGVLMPDTSDSFTADHLKAQYDVNVFGTAHCLEPVLKRFKSRNSGHIAIVGSFAGYRGLPRSISYGSSKAALIYIAEALAVEARGTDIKVQIINPGFIKTPMMDSQNYSKPMLMDVDQAADDLVRGLNGGFFEIAFPWVFSLLAKFVGLLPDQAYIWTIGKIKEQQFKKEGDDGSGSGNHENKSGAGTSKAA